MSEASLASKVRNRILASGERFWSPADFDGSPAAVAQTLSRMVRAGEIRRMRRGLYWRGAQTHLGMAPPPSPLFANEIIDGRGIGPAGWSAALELGLSTQVPRRDTFAIPTRTPRVPGSIHLVSRAASYKRRDENLRPGEVALLEALREWNALVEISDDDALGKIENFITTGALRPEKLARAADTEPPRVRERLRWLFDKLGRSELTDTIRPARRHAPRLRLGA
jgi:hypothetical protein